MSEMIRIKETIEGVISAIHSVIQVDVTVIDRDYNRIAATGIYTDQIGKRVAKNSVFYKALHNGHEYIVESPREEEVCFDCENRVECREYAEVCCPIFLEDQVVGIIGLVAFDEFQRDEVLNNKLNLLNFLKQMAKLISSKLLENRQQEIMLTQSKEIEVLFNYIDTAVVSIDTNGKIVRYNQVAKELLNIESKSCDLPFSATSKQTVSDHITCTLNGREERLIYQTRPIIIDGKLEQTVVTFKKEMDLIHEMNDLVNMKHAISFDHIIGSGPQITEVINKAKLSSKSDSTVLIQGESGTGKELFARAIHDESKRKNQPFVAINCAAIPESLIESELFGYADGAFTGALKGGKPGKFELADGGTIFLDEIGDMPIHLQTKLLRVLQEREVERVGGKGVIPIDVRVIAATHQNLDELIEAKMFRSDLYYRLNVIPIMLLPLRERLDDLNELSDFFLKRYSQKLEKNILGFSEEVILFFEAHDWKGNIREMENTIEYAVNMATSDMITFKDLPEKLKSYSAKVSCQCHVRNLEDLEKQEIERALEQFGRDKTGIQEALQALGISRATLYRKIKYYDL
ncbi:AAA family ATPase [Acidaminobacter sp. JC074]|uniref:sigma-54 interaction domain-containing protein n=1 Tax=Acidaminobacter sp. JC074 TaxID=2530199 RepID=UPI001F0EC61B|nr:sigma 54-interacting transcriptional regulator [Acidaminobacter sp. JC074]MCH4888228.1 AAA family ATPase [Acidaminobacter sp. JC074]